jgi:hypothetical protein
MNPTISNAFSNGDNRRPTANLASSLSPMQAKLTELGVGLTSRLSRADLDGPFLSPPIRLQQLEAQLQSAPAMAAP